MTLRTSCFVRAVIVCMVGGIVCGYGIGGCFRYLCVYIAVMFRSAWSLSQQCFIVVMSVMGFQQLR